MSYNASSDSEGVIQKIYIAHKLDNSKDVWMVQFKSGDEKLLNLVNPLEMKFDNDRLAVQKAQQLLRKKNPYTFICTIM